MFVRQRGEPGQAPVPIPPLKQTNMNINQTFLVGSVVVHYYNYYNTQLALHYILLGSGEPIKKSNFRYVRSPTVVFAIKPTWARARTCARQLKRNGVAPPPVFTPACLAPPRGGIYGGRDMYHYGPLLTFSTM